VKPIVVVDTNVPLAANGVADVSDGCVEQCVLELVAITSEEEKRVAIDLGGLILEEYRHKLSPAGQPGVGDAFLKWVYDNQAVIERCDQVEITPLGDEQFAEFPHHEKDLEKFDRSDRKFVAVACAHPEKPPILEAADVKWFGWAPALKRAGVEVHFLCAEIEAKWHAKHGAGAAAPASKVAKRKRRE
jgi:hypothetical protein